MYLIEIDIPYPDPSFGTKLISDDLNLIFSAVKLYFTRSFPSKHYYYIANQLEACFETAEKSSEDFNDFLIMESGSEQATKMRLRITKNLTQHDAGQTIERMNLINKPISHN